MSEKTNAVWQKLIDEKKVEVAIAKARFDEIKGKIDHVKKDKTLVEAEPIIEQYQSEYGIAMLHYDNVAKEYKNLLQRSMIDMLGDLPGLLQKQNPKE
jgi:hypothetical protein